MIWLRLALCALVLLAGPSMGSAETLTGTVVGIVDGDTFDMLDAEKVTHRIRPSGCDTPERGQPFWKAAKQSLSDLSMGRTVTVDLVQTGPLEAQGRHRASGRPRPVPGASAQRACRAVSEVRRRTDPRGEGRVRGHGGESQERGAGAVGEITREGPRVLRYNLTSPRALAFRRSMASLLVSGSLAYISAAAFG